MQCLKIELYIGMESMMRKFPTAAPIDWYLLPTRSSQGHLPLLSPILGVQPQKSAHMIRQKSRYAHFAEEHGHAPKQTEQEQSEETDRVEKTETRRTTHSESDSTSSSTIEAGGNLEEKEPDIPGVL